jgi:hypothetical protein
MGSNQPRARDGRRGHQPAARQRLGISLAVGATSVAAGSVGSRYLASVRFGHLGHLMHPGFQPGALLVLIITAGVVAVVLGWRGFVYLERRDQHHHEIISEMHDQEGVYLKYEDTSATYERWPTLTVAHGGQKRRRDGRHRQPQDDESDRGDVVHLGRHQHAASQTRAEGTRTGRGRMSSERRMRPSLERGVTPPLNAVAAGGRRNSKSKGSDVGRS